MLKEIQSDKYMYDVVNNILFYKTKNSISYYHEYMHYILNTKYNFNIINYILSYYNQYIQTRFFILFMFFMIIDFYINFDWVYFLSVYFILMLPYMFIIFIEELICDLYAIRKFYFKSK